MHLNKLCLSLHMYITKIKIDDKERLPKQNQSGVGRLTNHQPMASRTDGCHRHDCFPLENQQDTTLHGTIRRNRPPATV